MGGYTMAIDIADDKTIKEIINNKINDIKKCKREVCCIEITWHGGRYEEMINGTLYSDNAPYNLELHFNVPFEYDNPVKLGDLPGTIIKLCSVPEGDDDAFFEMIAKGEKIYENLKTDFPVLKMNLSF